MLLIEMPLLPPAPPPLPYLIYFIYVVINIILQMLLTELSLYWTRKINFGLLTFYT